VKGIVEGFELIVRTWFDATAVIEIKLCSIEDGALGAGHDFGEVTHLAGEACDGACLACC